MGAVNQLLSGTGLQVSASNTSNNVNVNNLPGSKLMARKRREEYEDDEQYAGDKYMKQNDMDDLEDDDYSMSDGEYEEDEEVREESEPDMSENTYDDYSSDDNGGYEEDYASASADGELGLRSGEDTVTYQINTEQQQNQLRPASSGNMDMYIGTSNLYSDLVGLKPETFRSESMDNEFDANDYIGFSPEGSVLPSVQSESIVGSFTGDDGIFGTLGFEGVQQEEESSFIPSLDGVFGFGGGQEEQEESPFVPSVAGAIGLGLGIGIGSALSVPTTMFSDSMEGSKVQQLNARADAVAQRNFGRVKWEKENAAKKAFEIPNNSTPVEASVLEPSETPSNSTHVEASVSEPSETPSDSTHVEASVLSQESKPSESKPSDKKKDDNSDDGLKKYKKALKRMNKQKEEASEKRINQYERSARELMNKNELDTNQYEAIRAAKRHSNDMADLRRQNQLAELQHTVAMRAKDKEMLDMMRNENIDAIKYNTEMKNRGQPQNGQYETMSPSNYTDDETIGSGLDDILGVGNNYDSGINAGAMGMSLGESLGISNGFGGFGGMGSSLEESLGVSNGFGGFGGMGVSIDASLGFGGNDYPSTMNAAWMDALKRGASKAFGAVKNKSTIAANTISNTGRLAYNKVRTGTEKAGNTMLNVGKSAYDRAKVGTETAGHVISDVGSTLYETRTNILNKTNPYRDAYSQALEQKNAIKARELDAKQKLRDKQQEVRNANAMRAQEARELRQARQVADMQHRIAMEAQRQELAQMRADAYDAQNMRNMMNDMTQALPNQGLSLGNNTSSMGLGLGGDAGGFGGLSLGVDNSIGGLGGMGLGDSLGLPTVRQQPVQQPLVQPQMMATPTQNANNPRAQYKSESEKYPYSTSPRLTTSVDDDGYGYSGGRGYHGSLFSEVMSGEIKPIKKARKSTSKRTKKVNKNKVKRVKKVAKAKTR